jgi:hypothetical protein
MMRIMISVALLFALVAGTTKANAVCVFGFGSDCPLSDREAINQIKPRLERQQLRFGQLTQNIVQVPGVGHTVFFEYSDGSNEAPRAGMSDFSKCSTGWCIMSLCFRVIGGQCVVP